MTDPLHRLTQAPAARWAGISSIGLPCPEHSSTTLSGTCYWHHKAAHLRGETVPLEARQWCGFDLPQPTRPRSSTDRGWRGAEDALRIVSRQDEEREAQVRGIRWLVDLDGTERELSV